MNIKKHLLMKKNKKKQEEQYIYNVETDKRIFFTALLVILLSCGICIIFPEPSLYVIKLARNFIVAKFDWFFMILGLAVLVISIFIGCSRYGKIHLAGEGEKPEFGFWSWLFMIFFSAIGSSGLMWSICEPIAYLIKPPFSYEPFSQEAFNISVAYGLFHWGPIPWAFFALSGLVVAYFFHIKQEKRLQLSHTLSDTIGKKNANGALGRVIDIVTVFCTFCTFGPSLGFGVPVLSALIANVTGLPNSDVLQIGVLVIWTMIFTVSVYSGLNKGIKILSDINMVLLCVFVLAVFLVAGPLFIIRSSLEETGTLIINFIRMSTYTDALNGGGFAQDWTVFYWIWWVVEFPFMAIFIARVSKGRTVRQLLFGIIGAGSIGTMSLFWLLGNYAIKLQASGTLDLAKIYQEQGATETVIQTIGSLPFSNLISIIMIFLYFVFLATCIDSGAFTMGCITSKEILDGQQPRRLNRSTWALVIALLGVTVLRLGGGIEAIQISVIVFGLPAGILLILMIWTLLKWLKQDYPN